MTIKLHPEPVWRMLNLLRNNLSEPPEGRQSPATGRMPLPAPLDPAEQLAHLRLRTRSLQRDTAALLYHAERGFDREVARATREALVTGADAPPTGGGGRQRSATRPRRR